MAKQGRSLIAAALLCAASLALAPRADAAPCGTVGTPGECSITVGGAITYSFTDFAFVTNIASGGAPLYGAEDIAIDLATAGGLTAQLTFSKPDGALSTVYLANAGQVSSFIFSYLVTAAPVGPGSIEFTSITTSYVRSVFLNGLSTVQGIVSGQVNCMVSPSDTSETCAISGEGPLNTGDIVTLAGLNGNTSILSFSNTFDAEVIADDPSPVPAPAGLAVMLAAGLGWAAMRRRRA